MRTWIFISLTFLIFLITAISLSRAQTYITDCTNITQPGEYVYSETCVDANYDGFCDDPYNLTTDNIDYLPIAVVAIL